MLANDIKKGARVQLRCGWFGTMADNGRGNTRMVTVEGDHTETGSVYTRDIVKVQPVGGAWQAVELSDRQKQAATNISAWGF